MTIPTLLTLLRIALIPVLIIVFYLPYGWVPIASAMIFSLAAITDWLDGYLARKLKQVSAFGAFLDPVADKLMVATALVLIVQDMPSAWIVVPAVIIIGREITVSALREWMAEIGASSAVAVNSLGKIKTAAQMTALIMLLFKYPLFTLPILEIGIVMLYISAILTLWSMIIYMKKAWPSLMAK